MHSNHCRRISGISILYGWMASITNVMGFMKGMLTSTASATRFSISRSIGRLYLALTYSGSAAYKHAMRPPRGVMPTRSPIPRTEVSMCVAPASSAVYAFAMAILFN